MLRNPTKLKYSLNDQELKNNSEFSSEKQRTGNKFWQIEAGRLLAPDLLNA